MPPTRLQALASAGCKDNAAASTSSESVQKTFADVSQAASGGGPQLRSSQCAAAAAPLPASCTPASWCKAPATLEPLQAAAKASTQVVAQGGSAEASANAIATSMGEWSHSSGVASLTPVGLASSQLVGRRSYAPPHTSEAAAALPASSALLQQLRWLQQLQRVSPRALQPCWACCEPTYAGQQRGADCKTPDKATLLDKRRARPNLQHWQTAPEQTREDGWAHARHDSVISIAARKRRSPCVPDACPNSTAQQPALRSNWTYKSGPL